MGVRIRNPGEMHLSPVWICANKQNMDLQTIHADLKQVATAGQGAQAEPLASVLQRLDQAAKAPGLPERLEHYLRKRSYQKALAWMEDETQKC